MGARPAEEAARLTGPDGGPGLSKRLRHADLSAVSEVRAALRGLLRHWGGPGRTDVAELLTSELVTNALLHTDQEAVVTATLGLGEAARVDGRLRVEVRDALPRHPTLRATDTGKAAESATSGRGLLLVHALADAWGVRAAGMGKAVWFELDPGSV